MVCSAVGEAERTRIRTRLAAVRYLAPGVNLYEFAPEGAAELPGFAPGAHIDVHLANGLVRQYSLVNRPGTGRYVVAVKRDAASRGGSRWLHEAARVGMALEVSSPRNNFPLHQEAACSIFIAGGIGITPMVPMVRRLRELGRPWQLHYAVRTRGEALFMDCFGQDACLHVDAEQAGRPLDLARIVSDAPPGAHLYCCGPAGMLDRFEELAARRPPETVHVERFAAATPPAAASAGYTVRLARSGAEIAVAGGQTLLSALRAHGVEVPTSCEQGICGSCETRVLGGRPDHRDMLLSPQEREANQSMMVCCSGSLADVLILDL